MKFKNFFLLTFLLANFGKVFATGNDLPVNNDFVDFGNIKNILKKDGLEKIVEEKKEVAKITQKKKEDKLKALYETPSDEDFWQIISEYWLVKNASILKWDFNRPNYGVGASFENFLRDVGELGISFKILFLNSSNITHFGMPFGRNSYLFLVSVPFIKAMDLSKTQISALLYEDLIRVKQGHFESKFSSTTLSKLKATNFYQAVVPKKELAELVASIDKIIYQDGFTFQEQYRVTKHVNTVLLNNKKLWQNYFSLIQRKDELAKSNLMFKNYPKIYPSPELQKSWIDPTKK